MRAYADKSHGNGHDAMRCFAPSHVPVLSGLAKAFAVCDQWFCSVPGETWPNRNYVHAATSDGEVNINKRFYKNRTIFELLEAAGHEWAVYHRGPAQVWAFPSLWESPFSKNEALSAARRARGRYPSRQHPELYVCRAGSRPARSQTHVEQSASWQQHPRGPGLLRRRAADPGRLRGVRRQSGRLGQHAARRDLRRARGAHDAAAPPRGVPPAVAPDAASHTGFTFDLLGVRVPTVLISPWIPAGTVDSTVYDHSAVPASLRERFAPTAAALTKRDAVSKRFWSNLSAVQPRPLNDIPDPAELQSQLDQVTALVALSAPAAPEAEEPKQLDNFQQSLLEMTMRVDAVLRTDADPFTVDVVTATLTPMAAQPLAEQSAGANRLSGERRASVPTMDCGDGTAPTSKLKRFEER